MLTINVNTINCRVKVHCPNQQSHDVFKFIESMPRIDAPNVRHKDMHIRERNGLYHLELSENYTSEGDLLHLLSDLHMWHFLQSTSEYPNAALFHACSVAIEGKLYLFFGDKGAGKSTLMTALGHAGMEVIGDEHVILLGENGITRPRTLRIKQSSSRYLPPNLRQIVQNSPCAEDWHSRQVYSVAPTVFGLPWHIRELPIAAIFVLKPNHGGFTHAYKVDEASAAQSIFNNTLLPEKNKFQSLIDVKNLLASRPIYNVAIGDLARASSIIYSITKDLSHME